MAHVKKGDNVKVIAGAHKGATGTVSSVNEAKQRVIVEGVRKIKKAIKRSEATPDGGIVEIDGPIALSNVKKVD
ncbi:50S ribosomal protein L24 [Rubritalea sp.]|uniref:50S ribosomal protein L24 n=1 Tax=Rubritalea sp. TaxID=2109375 RepID=UPI003EF1D143